MTKFLTRALVAVAVVAGGFVALTNAGTTADSLPTVPASSRASEVSRAPISSDNDLASWQETRITVPTSNVVPKKK